MHSLSAPNHLIRRFLDHPPRRSQRRLRAGLSCRHGALPGGQRLFQLLQVRLGGLYAPLGFRLRM